MKHFKVYPEVGDKFYTVLIFPTSEDMHRYWAHELGRADVEFAARCQYLQIFSFDDDESLEGDKCGEIIFHEGGFGAGVVSHEMTHAAVYYLASEGVDFGGLPDDKDADERLAWVQGNLVNQFWRVLNVTQAKQH